MLIFYIASNLHNTCSSSGSLFFAHIGGIIFIAHYISKLITDPIIYTYYLFIHNCTITWEYKFLLMDALCNFTPNIDYSVLIFLSGLLLCLSLKTALLRVLYCKDCITPRKPWLFCTKTG